MESSHTWLNLDTDSIYPNDLCILNINFRSVMNKRAEFLQIIDSKKPHIIVGTEARLSQSITNNEIPDNMNYTIYCKDREDGHP